MTRTIGMLASATALVAVAAFSVPAHGTDSAIEGVWQLEVEWPQRTVSVELEVFTGDEGLGARWTGPRGVLEAREVKFEEGLITFLLDVTSSEGNSVSLPYEGQVSGDEIGGSLMLPSGDTVKASGTRKDPAG